MITTYKGIVMKMLNTKIKYSSIDDPGFTLLFKIYSFSESVKGREVLPIFFILIFIF